LLIDTRDGDQRRRHGAIPGALAIDRTVLEWRVDPESGATHPAIGSLATRLVLICQQGYSSSLAVASLLDLGATDVTDVIGGFEAWRASGLPVRQPAAGRRSDPRRGRAVPDVGALGADRLGNDADAHEA
jgi:rhodanese-related sulfurtransferase